MPSPYSLPRNLVLVASAGTGKTYSLVGVMVHLLLGAPGGALPRRPLDPSRLVATTFSRRAAGEIRSRVAEALERLASEEPDPPYLSELHAASESAGAAWSREEVRQRARRAFSGLGRAQIGTLHSFVMGIVRQHALTLGLSPGFEVVDEDTGEERVREAIARVMGDQQDRGLLGLAAAAGGVEPLVEQLVRALGRLAEDGLGAMGLVPAGDEDTRALEASFAELLGHARALASDPVLGEAARALVVADQHKDSVALLDAAALLCGVPARGRRSEAAEAFFAFRGELPGATNADRGRNLVRAYRSRHLVGVQARAARDVLAACEAELRARALRESLLTFSDVLVFGRDLLRDHPDIAAVVGRTVDALLVDEFQDTSRVQKEIVELLWDRAPRERPPGSLPGLAALRGEGLLVVGDRKQSIYGFRGADVAVFAEVAVGLAGSLARDALGMPAGVVWEPETPLADFAALRHNRRAEPELLAFANAFSRSMLRPASPTPEPYEVAYVPETEDLVPPPGKEATGSARTTWLRVARGDGSAVKARRDEASVLAAQIVRIVEGGTPTVRGARPRWKDIAVLARTHEMLEATTDALARAGVPHVVAGQGFYAAREVRDLGSMLALLLDPADKLALLEVLRGPWTGVRDETLIGLTSPGRGLPEMGPGWQQGDRRQLILDEDREALAALERVVLSLRRIAHRMGPGPALREAVRALELEEALLLLPRGKQRVANVRKLLALADGETNARALLAKLYRAESREYAESEAAMFSDDDDAVRLLTAHASKGLDFPIVFVPEVGREPRPMSLGLLAVERGAAGGRDRISVRFLDEEGLLQEPPSYGAARRSASRREAAERARLAYVVATRASSALYFVGDRKGGAARSAGVARSLAEVLGELAAREESLRAATFEVVDAEAPKTQVVYAAPPPALGLTVETASPSPDWRSVVVSATALLDFAACSRRYQLLHVLDVPEGTANLGEMSPGRDPDSVAVAVRTRAFPLAPSLQRVGPRAAKLTEEGVEVRREATYLLRIPADKGPRVVIRGIVDLLVERSQGVIDALGFTRAHAAARGLYAAGFDLLSLAARELVPGATRIRPGLVSSPGESGRVAWGHVADVALARARIASLARGLVQARWGELGPPIDVARCRSLGCRYLSLCHGDAGDPQLSLFDG